ncbi:MAG: cohesin domain-containing protein, partial [Methanoregula sp.]
MKRQLPYATIMIFILVVLCINIVSAASLPGNTLCITNASGIAPGETATVGIYLNNSFSPKAGSITFAVTYDETIIQAQSVNVTADGVAPTDLSSPIRIAIATTNGIPTGKAWLANITFRAKDGTGQVSPLGLNLETLDNLAIPPRDLIPDTLIQNGTFTTANVPALLSVTNASGIAPGETATVGIYLNNSFNPKAGSITFAVTYDETIIQAQSVNVTADGVAPTDLSSPIRIAIATTNGIPTGKAWLANITFRAKDGTGQVSPLGLNLETLDNLAIPPRDLIPDTLIQNGTFTTANVPALLSVTNASGIAPGETATVGIYLNNSFNPKAGSITFAVTYDETIIQAQSVNVTADGVVPTDLSSPIRIAIATTNGIPTGKAWLANITFRAKDGTGQVSPLGLNLETLDNLAIPPRDLIPDTLIQNGTFTTAKVPALLSVTNASGIAPGETATVGIYLNNSFSPKAGSITFAVAYNETIIQAQSVNVTDDGVVPTDLSSPIRIALATTNGIPTGKAWLANITFRAKDGTGQVSPLGLDLETLDNLAIPPRDLIPDTLIQNGTFTTANVPAPVANFTGMPTTGTVPLTVAFTDVSTGTPTGWNWSFGDGSLV